ncbi:hypothetical protein C922_04488 [Plasmodium inui San Antonio 1]|uniref:Plasmodium RESA N-terminal domain-containing protein n=1 Tax=Plasmodium inui San Antonio 1 TaxID=1237626 RepID=W7A1A1_9APIC|nr:hypothetical protein C922_04488 [Plasmodium inui San Antonio 1]EUD65088.1 hypothetical protein C922_04488 [Plasmodium inui San Antonio 1]
MSYSSCKSLLDPPKIYQGQGMHGRKFSDDEIESYVDRGEDRRRNIRRGGGESSRACKNFLSKILTVSLLSDSLSCIACKSTMKNPGIPRHQIHAYWDYWEENARGSSYLHMGDHLNSVKKGSRTGAFWGDSYIDVRSNVSSNMSSNVSSNMSSNVSSNMSSNVSSNVSSNQSIYLGSETSSSSGSSCDDNLSDRSSVDIEIGEEVFQDSVLTGSSYDKIKLLKYDKIIEDDEVPLDCEASDFTADMTGEDIIESINNLDDPVPFRDMFILYNSFHQNERKKFERMQNSLKEKFEKVARKQLLEEGYKKEVWTSVSLYLIQELLKKDFVDFKSLYQLMNMEECTLDEYLHFLRTKKSSWKSFLRYMEAIGSYLIYYYVTRAPCMKKD